MIAKSRVISGFSTFLLAFTALLGLSSQDIAAALASDKAITGFSFSAPAATGVIDEGLHTIAITVPFGTPVTSLTPSISTSANASVSPLSSAPQDFTSPVTYTVTAEDNTTQTYAVTVTVAAPVLSSAKAITEFGFTSPSATGVITEGSHTIAVSVPFSTNVTSLVPTIAISANASISPLSGSARDFTSPVIYAVTAQDNSVESYTVTVTKASASTDATLSALTIGSTTLSPIFASGTISYSTSILNSVTSVLVTPTINQANATVAITVQGAGGAITPTAATGIAKYFVPTTGLNVITILVTAQDGTTTKTYTVNLTKGALLAPAAPARPLVTSGDRQATITVYDSGLGGAPSSYTVLASPGTGNCQIYGSGGYCTITGLNNGSIYTFTAYAQNSTGTSAGSVASLPIQIGITAAPGTPGTPTVVAGDGKATVTIVAPTTGGSPISYTVRSTPGNFSCTIAASLNSCVVNNLVNGTSYTFAVVATNATGSSASSPQSVAVKPSGVPVAPSAPTVVAGNKEVKVTVAALSTGTATSFIVTSSPSARSCTITGASGSCVVTNLVNGTSYTFTAKAINSGGTSAASPASAAVIPTATPTPTPTPSATPSPTPSATPTPTVAPQLKLRVSFAPLSSILSPIAKKQITAKLLKVSDNITSVRVEITGYIKSTKSSLAEKKASLARAKAISTYMKLYGLFGKYKLKGSAVGKAGTNYANTAQVNIYWVEEK